MSMRKGLGPSSAQRAQAFAVFALSLVALMALAALVVDGGMLQVQRRTAQNAADAAALAGARALTLATNASDTTVGLAICTYILNNEFGSGTYAVDPASAYYVQTDGTTTGTTITFTNSTCSSQASSTTIPSNAAGVYAGTQVGPYNTYLAGIIGLTQLSAAGAATVVVQQLNGYTADAADVVTCGDGAWEPSNPASPVTLWSTEPNIDYAAHDGETVVLQGSQMGSHVGDGCPTSKESGNGQYKEKITGTDVVVDNSYPLDNGNSDADLYTPCTDAGTPLPGTCYLPIPTGDMHSPTGSAYIVGFVCMQIIDLSGGDPRWEGIISDPSHCSYGQGATYTNSWTFGTGTNHGVVSIGLTG